MKSVLLFVAFSLVGCSSFTPKNYQDYRSVSDGPKTTIRFVPGRVYGPYTNLFFFDDASACTDRYVLGLVSPTFNFGPIRFDRNKRFAFTYLFQELRGGVTYCSGTYEFTPVENEYIVTLDRDDKKCYANVTEIRPNSQPQAVALIERRSRVPFSEAGAWCKRKN